jgi:hypothetical protein
MNSEQFTAIVKQALVRFGCTEAQAVRLAKSFSADLGNAIKIYTVKGEKGLASIRFPETLKGVAKTPSVRLVRLLQIFELADKENIGLPTKARLEIAPELDSWLRKPFPPPDVAAESSKPIPPVVQPRAKKHGHPPRETFDRWRDGIVKGD